MLLDFSPSPDLRCCTIALLCSLSMLHICFVESLSRRNNGNKLLRCLLGAAAFPARLEYEPQIKKMP
jgi:hypothetical protein